MKSNKISPFESYYAQNPVLAKSQARKLYRHIKKTAIELLQAECKRAIGGKKVTVREMIRLLEKEL